MTFISIGLLTAPNYTVSLHAQEKHVMYAKIRRAAEFLWRRRWENHGETLGASEKSVGGAAQGSKCKDIFRTI